MNEKPVIFNGQMVRAILDGRKTQTRRIVKPQPPVSGTLVQKSHNGLEPLYFVGGYLLPRCPYGEPGDYLWVRETHSWVTLAENEFGLPLDRRTKEGRPVRMIYRADAEFEGWAKAFPTRWRPSIHMPRWACRIILRIEEVRVERLKNICPADVWAEGIDPRPYLFQASKASRVINRDKWARAQFKRLWDSINGRRGFSWKTDPWVWVVKFSKVQS